MRQGHELRVKIRRCGVGGWRGNENTHFGEWESIGVYGSFAARKI